MPPIRFVHAADLHLDSPFRGLQAACEAIAQRLRRATFDTYDNIIALCLREQVDALLVAGDIYDESNIRLQAQLHFTRGLRKLDAAGIRSFVCHGNHDPLDGWSADLDLPPLSHRFGAGIEAVPLDPSDPSRATIHGISYETRDVRRNLTTYFQTDPNARFNIGLLHANVGGNTGHENYAPCTVDDLVRTGMDYWALGHVHTRQVLRQAGPAIVYPGNPQGRHVNEAGARGVYLVEVSETGHVSLEFREVDAVRWIDLRVTIEGREREQDLLDGLRETVSAAREDAPGRDLVCGLVIEGRGPLHAWVARDDTLETLRAQVNEWSMDAPFLYCGRIEDHTRPAWDRDERARGEDLVGDVIRTTDAALADDALFEGLAGPLRELYEHHELKRYFRGLPPREELRELLAESEARALDELVDAE
jgi:DNA repair exonuclease SbcCD nuclease subunit